MKAVATTQNSVIACVAYRDGRKVGEVPLDDISDVLERSDTFVWIGLFEPEEALLRKMQEEFSLHDLAIEDALTAHQRPKIERYENSLFVVLRTAQVDQKPNKPCSVESGEIHIFLGRNFVLTVRHGFATSFTQVRTRAESTPDLLRQGPAFVLYSIIDFIVDEYFPIVDALNEDLEALEHRIFTQQSHSRRVTTQIYKLKRELIVLKRIVSPVIELSARLIRFEDNDLIPAQTRPYFRDVYDHTLRINELIDGVRDMVNTALEAHLSLMSVAQNEDTRRLAAWAAIFAVPTAIAGIYGMNFDIMPELRWQLGYPFVLSVIVGLCLYLYLRFKKAKWL